MEKQTDTNLVQDPEPERYYDWMLWKLRQENTLERSRMKTMSREEMWKKTVADLQTEIHELQMMVVRLQEKLNKIQEDNYDEEEANRRMDIIGQNGNDGLHYSEVEDSNLHGPEFRQRFRT